MQAVSILWSRWRASPPAQRPTYHSFQLNLQKRLGHGLSFLVGYTMMKQIANGGFGNQGHATTNLQHTLLRDTAKSIYFQDRPQTLVASYVYDLPFGRGKPFWKNPNGFVQQLAGGWRVAATHRYFSGTPVTIGTFASLPGGVAATGGGVWANRVEGVPIRTGNGCGNYDPNDPGRNRYPAPKKTVIPSPVILEVKGFLGRKTGLRNPRHCGGSGPSITTPISECGPSLSVVNLTALTGY